MPISRWLLACALLAGPGAQAQTLLIRGATLHTVSEAGVIEQGDILITDGLITAVGTDLAADGAAVIDGAGAHVTPGLANAYTQLGVVEIELVDQTVDAVTTDPAFSASFSVAPAINFWSTLLPQNRLHGLTLALVAPQAGHSVFAGQGAAIRLDDPASMIIEGSLAVYGSYGIGGGTLAGGSRAAAFARLRQGLRDALEYDRHRDRIAAGDWREFTLPLHDLEALVPVVKARKPFVIVAHRASDILRLLDLRQEFGLNLVIAGAVEGWRVADALAAAGVPVIIDPMANLPQNFDQLAARLDNGARLHASGVTLLFTGGQYINTHAAYLVRQAAGNAVAYGMPHEAALAAMTRNTADAFGLGDRFGSIAPGKAADLVVWNGDPLELMTQPLHVIVDGHDRPLVSRATRLRDRYRDLERPGEIPYRH